jgi:hypothetical protein
VGTRAPGGRRQAGVARSRLSSNRAAELVSTVSTVLNGSTSRIVSSEANQRLSFTQNVFYTVETVGKRSAMLDPAHRPASPMDPAFARLVLPPDRLGPGPQRSIYCY